MLPLDDQTRLRRIVRRTVALPRLLTTASYKRPKIAMIAWAVLMASAGPAAIGIEFETSISSLLDTRSDDWANYQRSLDRHGSDEFISVAYASSAELSEQLLSWIVSTTNALESIAGVERVDGLASTALIRVDADGELSLSPATESFEPDADSYEYQLSRALDNDLIAPGAYISEDRSTASLNVVLDDQVAGDRLGVVEAVRSKIGTDALISGVPIFRTAINDDTRRETFLFVPIVIGAIALVLAMTFRRLQSVVLPLTTGGIGSTVVVAVHSLSGTPLSLSTMILPSILLALGCAYALHPVSAWASARESLDAIADTAGPVALSGLTTAIGFASLAASPIETIRALAVFGSLGVATITLASLTFVPAVLATSAPRDAGVEPPIPRWARRVLAARLSRFAYERPGVVLGAWGTATVVAAFGLTKLEVSTDIVSWYPETSKIRRDYNAIRASMSGITPVSFYVEADGSRRVTEPEVVRAIDTLGSQLESRREVGKVLSIVHPLRLMKRAYSPGDHGLPTSEAEVRQFLLLLESEEAVWDVVSRDSASARIALRLNDNSSDAIERIADLGVEWWNSNGPSGFSMVPTGIMYQFARANRSIVQTQVAGLLIAFLGMAVVLLLVLKSPASAFSALLPNLLPLSLAYGGMGLAGIPLDSGTACLGSLALGIAVDDTVHLSTNWASSRAKRRNSYRAMREAMGRVMPALSASTVCIALGFAALSLSELGLVRNLGLMTATVVVVCWLADVTLLPVLLRQYEPAEREE